MHNDNVTPLRRPVAMIGNLADNTAMVACDDGTTWAQIWDDSAKQFTWVPWCKQPIPGTRAALPAVQSADDVEESPNGETPMPVTILDVGLRRGVQPTPGSATSASTIPASEFGRVGLPFLSGCEGCGAALGVYNAHPSRSGFVRCEDCIGAVGFETVEEFESFMLARGGRAEA